MCSQGKRLGISRGQFVHPQSSTLLVMFSCEEALAGLPCSETCRGGGGVGVVRLGCPAWSRSIRETDHTPAMTMHSAAGAEAR